MVFNRDTLELISTRKMPSKVKEGWGITHNNKNLIVSDGTSRLSLWNIDTLEEEKSIRIKDKRGKSVKNINELEYVSGYVYANIWLSDEIVRFPLDTGIVERVYNMKGILDRAGVPRTGQEDVLNGIAYNPENDSFYVTGKLWPALFEVKLSHQLEVS